MVMPVIVTVLLGPMFLLANVAVAPLWSRVIGSLPWIPESAADVLIRSGVATADALYTRLFAVIPVTVRFIAVMEAVVEG